MEYLEESGQLIAQPTNQLTVGENPTPPGGILSQAAPSLLLADRYNLDGVHLQQDDPSPLLGEHPDRPGYHVTQPGIAIGIGLGSNQRGVVINAGGINFTETEINLAGFALKKTSRLLTLVNEKRVAVRTIIN